MALTILSHDPDPSEVNYGVLVDFQYVVDWTEPTADFTVSAGTDSCTATPQETSCVLFLSTPGTASITVSFPGDALYPPTESPPVIHEVLPATMPALVSRGRVNSPYSDSASGARSTGFEFLRPAVSISADGRRIAFETDASNLVPDDNSLGIVLHDRQLNTAIDTPGDWWPSLSGDGQTMASITDGSIDERQCIFYDLDLMTVTPITEVEDLTPECPFGICYIRPDCTKVSMSPDGDRVAVYILNVDISTPFRGSAGELFVAVWRVGEPPLLGDDFGGWSGDFPGMSSVNDSFVRTFEGDILLHPGSQLVSIDSMSNTANGASFWPAISADGRYVAFSSDATNLVDGDANSRRDIFVHDTVSGATTRVSVDGMGNEGNDHSDYPTISSSGRFVAFHSDASDLVTDDTNGVSDVFVHDRHSGATVRLSVDRLGEEGNGASIFPVISGNGSFVAFSSEASNLVRTQHDMNGLQDVFVAAVPFPILTSGFEQEEIDE